MRKSDILQQFTVILLMFFSNMQKMRQANTNERISLRLSQEISSLSEPFKILTLMLMLCSLRELLVLLV